MYSECFLQLYVAKQPLLPRSLPKLEVYFLKRVKQGSLDCGMLGSYGQRYCTHIQMHTGHEIKKTMRSSSPIKKIGLGEHMSASPIFATSLVL